MKTISKLTIEHAQTVKVNRRIYLWVDLTTETESRRCCYARYGGTWQYEDGDNEPAMAPSLLAAFHGSAGDEALSDVYRTREPITQEA